MEPGDLLRGRYRIDRLVGSGGMGSVYCAWDTDQNRRVAIKSMDLTSVPGTQRLAARHQFTREAFFLATLTHPGLASFYEVFDLDDTDYMVMEYIEGVTLAQLLRNSRTMRSPATVMVWIEQIADALVFLHRQKPPVLFRDLKPGNVMLAGEGRIRLIDFGIARLFDPDLKTTEFIRGMGTPGFAAVEQFAQGGTDERTDIYALAATMYALLTHRAPPPAMDLLMGDAQLVPAHTINPQVSPGLDLALRKLMAADKRHRPPSVEEAMALLHQVVPHVAQSGYPGTPGDLDIPTVPQN